MLIIGDAKNEADVNISRLQIFVQISIFNRSLIQHIYFFASHTRKNVSRE